MGRIGIFGGSFNPIHYGHIELGRALCRERRVDQLWYVVSPLNPLKAGDKDLAAPEDRLDMARAAAAPFPELQVSDIEFSLPQPSYMAHTLAWLRVMYPADEFVLVIGADNWLNFPRWYHSEEILATHRILVYPRPGYELPDDLPVNVTKVDTPLYNVSATQIRTLLEEGRDTGELIPPQVMRIIRRRHLYGV